MKKLMDEDMVDKISILIKILEHIRDEVVVFKNELFKERIVTSPLESKGWLECLLALEHLDHKGSGNRIQFKWNEKSEELLKTLKKKINGSV